MTFTDLDRWFLDADDVTVVRPPREEPGHWAGAPYLLGDGERVYLYYRLRRPRGEGRGYEARIAESRDGFTFDDIWGVTKEELQTPSIERAALVRAGDSFRLYLSYVDPATHKWKIDACEAPDPRAFRVATRVTAVDPDEYGLEAAKDPVVIKVGPVWYLYASCAMAVDEPNENLHAGDDVFTTGRIRSPTCLFLSDDGFSFRWAGEVLSNGAGWDRYMARLTAWAPHGDAFVAFYDGSASVAENYEERAALALSTDLRRFRRRRPHVSTTTPPSPMSKRYVSTAFFKGRWLIAYEAILQDGTHELRIGARQ